MTDETLVNLARPFSKVLRIVPLSNKGQAFIQLEDAEKARAMVEAHELTPLQIEGQTLFVNPSQRQQVCVKGNRCFFCFLNFLFSWLAVVFLGRPREEMRRLVRRLRRLRLRGFCLSSIRTCAIPSMPL